MFLWNRLTEKIEKNVELLLVEREIYLLLINYIYNLNFFHTFSDLIDWNNYDSVIIYVKKIITKFSK